MAISDVLKISIEELIVIKKDGEENTHHNEIHAGKNSTIFRLQFTEKYVIELMINKKKKRMQ